LERLELSLWGIRIAKPTLVAAPAVHDLHYEVPYKGWLTDEKAAALRLYEGASKTARADGIKMEVRTGDRGEIDVQHSEE
jgi:hypothetical protein